MQAQTVIAALSALAHDYRLKIYRLLIEQGPEGLSAGAIGELVGLIPSSLTFHLQNLQRAGMITQRRIGRQLIYSADFSAMNGLIGYLTDNCCGQGGAEGGRACKPLATDAKVRSKTRRAA